MQDPVDDAQSAPEGGLRIDAVSELTGISVRNIREYQDRGLLPPPGKVGRIAWYQEDHVVRLQLIDRLLRRGYTIAVIRDLLDAWAEGRDLQHVLGLETAVSESWSPESPGTATIMELRRMFGRQLTPSVIRRALRLEILVSAGMRAFHVPSPGLLEAGRDLVAAGIPLRTVMDVIERVADELDRPAERLIRMVFEHTFPPDAPGGIPEGEQVMELTAMVEKLRPHALTAIEALAARSLARAVDSSFDDLTGRVSAAAPISHADRRDA